MSWHDDIIAVAGPLGAVYIGRQTIAQMALDTLNTQLGAASGTNIPVVATPFFTRLASVTTAGGNPPPNAVTKLVDNAGVMSLSTRGGFVLRVEIGARGQASGKDYVLTDVDMLINDLAIEIEAFPGALKCSPATAVFIPTITRRPEFEQVIAQLGLDEKQVTRIEGVVAYGGIQTVVASMLKTAYEIDFSRLFPGISLQGQLKLAIIDAGEALVIIPANGLAASPKGPCECADVGEGLGEAEPGIATPGSGAGGKAGVIAIGGPTAPAASSVKLGRRRPGISDTGLYIPRSVGDGITSGPYPAVRVDVGSNGFIRWRASAIVDFHKIGLTFDHKSGALVLSFKSRVDISGRIEIDLGKLGTIKVCRFYAVQSSGSNEVIILLSSSLTASSTLSPWPRRLI